MAAFTETGDGQPGPAELSGQIAVGGTLKRADTAAARASGSTTRPPLPQPWAKALSLLLDSGPSPFEATRQPFTGRPETEDLRTNPLITGTCSRELLLPEYSSAARLRDMLLRTLDWHAAAGSGGFYAA